MIAILTALLLSTAEVEQLRLQVRAAEEAFHKQVRELPPCSEQMPAGASPVMRQRYDVNSRGDFYDIYLRLRKIAYEPTAEFETLKITAAEKGTVVLEAKAAEACVDLRWLESREPAPLTSGDIFAEQAARHRKYLEELKTWSAEAAKARERNHAKRVTKALDALTSAWNDEPVMLRELQLAGDTLTIRGVALGAPRRESIKQSFARVDFSRSGDCSAFTAQAPLSTITPNDEAVVANVFDERIDVLCNATLPAAKALSGKGTGTLTLRARDLDATALFMLLNELSPADGFVVDQTVTGRFDVDFRNMTIGEIFDVLKANGVANVGAGPLHRVCKSVCATGLPEQTWAGEPVTIMVASADVLDVYRTFSEVRGLKVQARALPGTISIFARDVEWDRLFTAVTSAIGKTYAIKGDAIHLDEQGAVPIEQLLTGAVPRRPLIERDSKKLGVEDLRVAAIVSNGVSTTAWVRVPGSAKHVMQIDPGTELFDGRVEAIAAGGVTVKTADGREVVLGN
jgi:hypothetical protein